MDVVTLLDRGRSFEPSTSSIGSSCSKCEGSIVFVVRSAKICWGYIYSSGSAHFEVVGEVEAPGIVAKRQDDRFVVELYDKTWTFEAPAESSQWMFLFPGSPAIGKTVSALGLDELGVRAAQMQRDWKPSALDEGLVLQGGDRLLMFGRHSALRKAWNLLKPP